jgi:hypothetical protein
MTFDPIAARLLKLEALAARPGTPGERQAAEAALARIRGRLASEMRPTAPRTVTRPKSCRCGSNSFVVEAGRGPHAAHLRCEQCGRGGTWMSRAEFEKSKSEERGP